VVCTECGCKKLGAITERPAFYRSSAFAGFLLWTLGALGGLTGLVVPAFREWIGLGPYFIGIETAFAAWASFSAFHRCLWDTYFYHVEVTIPETVAAREPFEVDVQVVPHETLQGVSLSADLVSRHFVQDSHGQWSKRFRLQERFVLMRNQSLNGRKSDEFSIRFRAPFPIDVHDNMMHDVQVYLLKAAGLIVPGARHIADNMKESAGYFVRVRVKVGWFWRNYQKRVVSYYVGNQVLVS
jgi:hypothetical protein